MSGEKIVVKVDPDLEELIPGFLENRGKDLARMRTALSANDFPGIQSIGHSLKGVGGGYGFMRISDLGAEIEKAAKSGNAGALPGLIDALADYLGCIVVEYD